MKTLIGSTALAEYIDGITPDDVDYFAVSPVAGAETFYHPRLELWNWSDVATLDELYTIKVSHSFWELQNNSWDKHMFHITKMQQAGATFLPELYDILYPVWEEIHGAKQVSLEKTPEEFFTETVSRVYDHDSIHNSVAYYDEPLFNAILRDNSEVAVSREKFENLSEDEKIKLVFEEIYATALERLVIPSEYKYQSQKAFAWARRKLITSFSKGWFPLWIVLNFEHFIRPDSRYVQTHLNNKHKLVLL